MLLYPRLPEFVSRTKTTAAGQPYVSNRLNQYDAVGAITLRHDKNGNLTFDGVNVYGYDSENRLIRSTGPSGTAFYAYDALGRRVSKTVNGVTTAFLYDGDQVIADLDGAGKILARYVYGPGIDEPLVMLKAGLPAATGAAKAGKPYYFHADALGSIIALTDERGQLVERYTYDAFGTPTILDPAGQVRTTSIVGNRFLFTGREYDAETGLYYYRNRCFHPGLGRFVSRDPLGLLPDVNLYRYVGNNPVNFADPLGLDKQRTQNQQCTEEWAQCYANCINTFAPGFPQFFVGSQIASNFPYRVQIELGPTPWRVFVSEKPALLARLFPRTWAATAAVSRVVRPIQAVGFSYVAGASYGCMISCATNSCNY